MSFGSDQFLGDRYRAAQLLVDAAWGAVLLAAAVGLWVASRRGWRDRLSDPTALCVVFVALGGLVVPALFFGDPRFKVAVAPCIAVLAAVGMTSSLPWQRWGSTTDVEGADDTGDVAEVARVGG
ncbi:MAG: hypothetical protein ACKOYM_11720 [Actinomycetes bacterium]